MNGLQPALVRRFELGEGGTAWPTAGLFLAALAVQAAAAAAWLSGRWPAAATLAVATACAYAQFTVVHDATHGTLSRVRAVNDGIGVLATLVLCGPFAAIRRNHLHHHAHVNDPARDPDYWVAGRTATTTLLRCLSTLQAHYWSYLTRLRRRDAAFAWSLATIALIAAVHGAAWRAGRLGDLLLCWTLPAQLAVALLALTFDYWPHRPHSGRGRLRDTANILPAWLDPLFLRQNLHAVHHLFPTLPWYRYRRAWEVLDPGLRAAGVPQWEWTEAVRMLRPGRPR